MLTMKKYVLIVIFFIIITAVHAQEFGFGFDDDAGETASPVSVKISGDIAAGFTGYVHDFSSDDKAKDASLGDILSGSLNFGATGANVDAFVGLNLSAAGFSEFASGLESPASTPLILDEAYLRAYFGPVNVQAGYRKLTWGKADSLGPLDVINPLDYTELTNISDILAMKIARPLVRVSWDIDGFSKLEAVFIPNFAGYRFAQSGRWAPAQFSTMRNITTKKLVEQIEQRYPMLSSDDIDQFFNDYSDIYDYLLANNPDILQAIYISPAILQAMYPQMLTSAFSDFSPGFPDTSGLEYFQTGLRFTTTVGPADIGAQYFYGNLFQPVFTLGSVDAFIDDLIAGNASFGNSGIYTGDLDLLYKIRYNRYHQIGLDYAQVLFGFNIRGEFAVNLTEDLKGNDGSVRNPFLAWSLGFDRDLFWGVNANMQCNETIRLLNDKVGTDPALDCEAGTEITSTRFTMQLSKRFLKDELECKVITIWGVEDSDCYIIPAIVWNIKDLTAELAAGVFAGKDSGELGQYRENSFIKIGLAYSF